MRRLDPDRTANTVFTHTYLKNPRFVAEMLNLYVPLLAQYAAAGVRSRYVELLTIAFDEFRARFPALMTAGESTFRPLRTFPDRGEFLHPDGRAGYKALTTIELRTRFLLLLTEKYWRTVSKSQKSPAGLSDCVASLVIGLRRVLHDSESETEHFHK